MGQQRKIIFKNNSMNQGSACLFQQGYDMPGVWEAFSLAWMCRNTMPSSMAEFAWSDDYCYVAGTVGQLRPGVTFKASTQMPGGLTNENIATLEGGPKFLQNGQRGQPGTITISSSMGIPNDGSLSAGFGMSNQGVFVFSTRPNMNYTCAPHPTYRMAFGQYQQGQALDTGAMGNTVTVNFPSNIFTMYVTLNADNIWSVSERG
jgi:hypothetical protein